MDPESYFSDGYCKIMDFMDVSCRDFSNWLIAAITAERIIVTGAPLKVGRVLGQGVLLERLIQL